MKDSNYILIQGWMVNRLNLSGNELMVYAVIYGFSQDEESKYEGSGRYIADSLGISRRAVFTILENLVKKGFLKKFDRFERNLKFCDYQANPEYFPKKDNQGGDEKTSPVVKYLHRGGGEESSPGGGEKTSPHITNSYINNTSSSELSDSKTDPRSENDENPKEEEDLYTSSSDSHKSSFSQDEIKNALFSVDKTLFLDNFYPQATAFMSKHNLDINYLDFIYNQTSNTNYKSFKSMFYTLFFKDNKADEYKALNKPSETSPPPPDDIKCPVCGTVHEKNADKCPNCSLPINSPTFTISLFRELIKFPVDRRNEYLKRENVIYSEFKGDFKKLNKMIDSLKKEFNLRTSHEEPSRSYHP